MGNKGGKNKKKDHTILRDEEIDFLLNNTSFSRDEILKWHSGFMRDCPNGLLNLKQFTSVFKEFYPNGRAEKFSAQVFDVFDADQSGKIDFVEFLVAIASSSQADIRQRLKLGFKMYDKDNNGKIDKKEMLKMLLAIYDLMGQENRSGENDPKIRVDAIFTKLDRDNNGNLDETEFIDGCLGDPVLMKILVPQIRI